MQTEEQQLVALEKRFWQSMVDEDTATATAMLDEPALMVSGHGAFEFDHAGYRKMATQDSTVLKAFELGDIKVMFATDDVAVLTYKVRQTIAPRRDTGSTTKQMHDSSTWVRKHGAWRCVMHTETPAAD